MCKEISLAGNHKDSLKVKDQSIEAASGPVEETVERGDTPAQDETDIILEVLKNVHFSDTAATGPSPGKVASLITRQVSEIKVEYLPSCENDEFSPCPSPRHHFLVLVGSSHLYSHSSVLRSQLYFISSSKFLLPEKFACLCTLAKYRGERN